MPETKRIKKIINKSLQSLTPFINITCKRRLQTKLEKLHFNS